MFVESGNLGICRRELDSAKVEMVTAEELKGERTGVFLSEKGVAPRSSGQFVILKILIIRQIDSIIPRNPVLMHKN